MAFGRKLLSRITAPARRMIALGRLLGAILVLGIGVATTAPALAQTVNYDLSTTSVMRIKLPVSQAVTVTLSAAVGKIVSADPKIADAQPITDTSVYLVGKAFGTTTVNLYSADGTPVGLLAVEVGADTADMSHSIRSGVPNSRVKVSTVNGRVQLSGTVPDADSMQKVLDIVNQYGSPAVINTITLTGGQQVNLEVRILEAQRDAGRELGISWNGTGTGGSATISGGPNNPSSDATSFSTFITNIITGGVGFNLSATINALETKGLVRTLADPNLTTLSGINASFLAGGQVPIRVPDANGNATLNFHDFGVKLVFTPVVLDGDRIQIHLTPEVSDVTGFTT
ncbi:MAG TPA: pilus assembly protein N-terminal domain-containing protein, partial [Devosia sp.]|nr:pilus assembly protein N-terminal domain-containing protein [Devosia sp.]